MTAQRWWVKLYARWVARVQAVQGQLNLFFTALSGTSLASGALKYFGAPTWLIGVFLAGLAALLVAYVYLYSEGGVWNQLARDRQDMSNNFAGPNSKIQTEMMARALRAGEKGEPLSESERNAVKSELDGAFAELRDGIELDEN